MPETCTHTSRLSVECSINSSVCSANYFAPDKVCAGWGSEGRVEEKEVESSVAQGESAQLSDILEIQGEPR
jgi:hypothetical protein